MEVSEDLFEFAEELRIGWGRDELLRELLAGQCDVGLVDRDGLPHRLADKVVKCRKRIALSERLKDEGDLPTHLPVGDWYALWAKTSWADGLRDEAA